MFLSLGAHPPRSGLRKPRIDDDDDKSNQIKSKWNLAHLRVGEIGRAPARGPTGGGRAAHASPSGPLIRHEGGRSLARLSLAWPAGAHVGLGPRQLTRPVGGFSSARLLDTLSRARPAGWPPAAI